MIDEALLPHSSSNQRRLLLLSPFAPHPEAGMGGPVVIAGLITALSRYERIALLYLRGDDEPAAADRVMEACEIALEVRRPGGERRAIKRSLGAAWSALSGIPAWVADWRVPEFRAQLTGLMKVFAPELIQAEFHLMGQYFEAVKDSSAVRILTQHEPGAAALADRRQSGFKCGTIMPLLEQQAWLRYERAVLNATDACVTFTERDRAEMRRLNPDARVEVIAPGARLPIAALDARGSGRPALLFFGNYLHPPNVDAALRLARDIFPRVAAECPDLLLWLPGDRPTEQLQTLASDRIITPGRVDTIEPYLDAAAVVVAPLRIGGGMRVKVVETLAAGKALVASRLAVEGLGVVDREHCLLAETDEEFAAATCWLLEHPDARARLGARARTWAAANLSWDRAARQYVALYEDLLTRHSARDEAAGA